MEQWVSDTFYSYFPGFNNEYQKRQNLLRDRQKEYQENFLKHQVSLELFMFESSTQHKAYSTHWPKGQLWQHFNLSS